MKSFAGVDVAEGFGYTFFFYDPGEQRRRKKRFPFATIAKQDNEHDRVSNLNRPGVFRLNIGSAGIVSRIAWRSTQTLAHPA
jgi:hypothetical protein